MTLQENLTALLEKNPALREVYQAKPEDREALMVKLMKQQAPKFERRNPHTEKNFAKPSAYVDVRDALSDEWQKTREIADKTGWHAGKVYTALHRLKVDGLVIDTKIFGQNCVAWKRA